jgi:putative transposase
MLERAGQRARQRCLLPAAHWLPVATAAPRISAANTVYHYFSAWRTRSVWTKLQWALHKRVWVSADRAECPNAVIVDGQSVKTTERGGPRGLDGHKRVKGRKRRIRVDTLGLPIASQVEPANTSDRKAGYRLLGGLHFALPAIGTIAGAGHESRELARQLQDHDGYELCNRTACHAFYCGTMRSYTQAASR